MGARHESAASAIGTDSPAAIAAPIWIELAYTPVTSTGRSAKRSLTATIMSALPSPMPMPIGIVSATAENAPGSDRAPDAADRDQADARP